MRHAACWLLIAIGTHEAAAQAPKVAVDPRFELVSLVFHLTGSPDYSSGGVPAYEAAVAKRFAGFAEHPAVQRARQLQQQHGVYFDAPASLAPLIESASSIRLRAQPSDSGVQLDRRWPMDSVEGFVRLLKSFAEDTRFFQFLRDQRALTSRAEASLGDVFTRFVDLRWYSRFFGGTPDADFLLIPGMMLGGQNYGLRFTPPRRRGEVWAVIGVAKVDSAGIPSYTDETGPIIVHEYGHSFLNPVVERWLSRLVAPAERMTSPVRDQLKRWGYGQAHTTAIESMIGAFVAVYLQEHATPAAVSEHVLDDQRRGFLWEPGLVRLLESYQRSRDTFPTFEAFMPRVVEFFERTAGSIDSVVASYDLLRPAVAGVEPSLAAPLQGDTVELRIRFDRRMRAGARLLRDPNAPSGAMPRVIATRWNDAMDELTLRLTVQPSREYRATLSDAVSADGYLTKPFQVRFRTDLPRR